MAAQSGQSGSGASSASTSEGAPLLGAFLECEGCGTRPVRVEAKYCDACASLSEAFSLAFQKPPRVGDIIYQLTYDAASADPRCKLYHQLFPDGIYLCTPASEERLGPIKRLFQRAAPGKYDYVAAEIEALGRRAKSSTKSPEA